MPSQRPEQAIAQIKAALLRNPGNAALLNELGNAYAGADQTGEAITAYGTALALRPDFAEAHFNLGNTLNRQGNLAAAADSYRHAIHHAPGASRARINLGVTLSQMGAWDEAAAELRQAVAINARSFEAQFNLGIVLAAQGSLDEAAAAYRAALRINPQAAQAAFNLGAVLEQQQQVAAAIGCYRQVIAWDPHFIPAYSNLGSVLSREGRFVEAIAVFRDALKVDPKAAPVHLNLGVALEHQQRFDEAILCYERAIALDRSVPAYNNLGKVLTLQGRLEEGFAYYRQHATLKYGRPDPPDAAAPSASPAKLRHDREQFDYLTEAEIAPASVRQIRDAVAADPSSFGARFAELFHLEGGARLAQPAVNPDNDTAAIEAAWDHSRPNLVVIDDLLTPEALDGMRRYCWGSTIWRSAYPAGYLGAFPDSGFACPLLAQIVEELRAKFPRIIRRHPLAQWWAFKYDSQLSGINIHADFAAVNVNFWITPDDANLDPEGGGLEIWDVPAPLDWDFEQYNRDNPQIAEFLRRNKAKSVTVPYRANRAVIFDSDLFHETGKLTFKEGYRNRRINITLLYGWRHDASGNEDPV
jgi:tetratricopeptide (TPR) repeat protein